MAREKRDATFSPERMLAREDFLLDPVGSLKHAVDLTHLFEALDARGDWEDVVFLARFDEQRARRDESGDVVHLAPVQNAGHVVVDAVREAADTVAERVEIPADHRGANAGLERGREQCRRAAARDAHTADVAGVELGAGGDVVDGPHDVPHAPSDHGLTEQQRAASRRLTGFSREALARVNRIAPAAKRHRLDGYGGETLLHHLDGKVVLIPGLVRPIAS